MGRATIIEDLGEGQYSVEVDYGNATIQARINRLSQLVAAAESEKTAAEAALSAAHAAEATFLSSINSAIDAYRAKLVAGEDASAESDALNRAVRDHQSSGIATQKAAAVVSAYDAEIVGYNKQITYLSSFEVVQTVDVWCADYTEEADGECGTIEIPGEAAQVILVPGCAAPTVADGEVVARVAQDSKQLFLNLALLPGWQKWTPTYRIGVIDTIDYPANRVELTLDDATSSAQDLDINLETEFIDVPVGYMDYCDATSFLVGDRVLVELEDHDWEEPRVIGFESHPRAPWPIEIKAHHEPTYNQQFYEYGRFYGEGSEEIRDLYDAFVVPDPYPARPGEMTALEFWVKPEHRDWMQMEYNGALTSLGGSWQDARSANPAYAWYAYQMYKNIDGEEYIHRISRVNVGVIPSPAPTRVDASWEHDTGIITGYVQYLLRRTSDKHIYYHVAVDMENRRVRQAAIYDAVGRYVAAGGSTSLIPGFYIDYNPSFVMSAPPP